MKYKTFYCEDSECPYYEDKEPHGICTLENPLKECDYYSTLLNEDNEQKGNKMRTLKEILDELFELLDDMSLLSDEDFNKFCELEKEYRTYYM